VNRAEFVAAAAAAVASPAPPRGVWAAVSIVRDGTALLAPFTVTVDLHNPTGRTTQLRFPTTDLFRIDVLRDEGPIWSSVTGHKPSPITRQVDVPPGLLRLGEVVVDATTDDRRAFAPGTYVVRVAMLGTNFGAIVDQNLRFDPPLTIAAALAAKPATVVTVAGEPYIDGAAVRLRDATGNVRLSRGVGLRGTFVVRGFVDARADERVFDVGRSAPAFASDVAPGT
jgi:hypothetical protein